MDTSKVLWDVATGSCPKVRGKEFKKVGIVKRPGEWMEGLWTVHKPAMGPGVLVKWTYLRAMGWKAFKLRISFEVGMLLKVLKDFIKKLIFLTPIWKGKCSSNVLKIFLSPYLVEWPNKNVWAISPPFMTCIIFSGLPHCIIMLVLLLYAGFFTELLQLWAAFF